MNFDFFDLIIKVAQLSILLPIAIAFLRFRSLSKVQRLLLILLLVSLTISSIARYLWSLKENNLYLLHYYTVLEYCFWSGIFYLFFEGKFMKRFIVCTGILFIAFAILNSVFWQDLSSFNSYSRSVESILLVGFSIYYYLKMFKEEKILILEKNVSFWINAAVLVYFSGSFLLFGFSNLLLRLNSHEKIEVWGIHGVFLIIHYILITIGLWIRPEKRLR